MKKHILSIFMFVAFFLVAANQEQEHHFSHDAFFEGGQKTGYNQVIQLNTSFHAEASQLVAQELLRWCKENEKQQIDFLDLASGVDLPVVSDYVFRELEKNGIDIRYTAIDINEKLATVDSFDFSSNVIQQSINVGDAYNLPESIRSKKYSIIYAGLNLHHLGPRELYKVSKDLHEILHDDGMLVVFDLFRLESKTYSPKPSEKALMDEALLAEVPSLSELGFSDQMQEHSWNKEFAELYAQNAIAIGMDPKAAQEALDHIAGNDFPLSMDEWILVLTKTGFKSFQATPFSRVVKNNATAEYFSIVTARKVHKIHSVYLPVGTPGLGLVFSTVVF